MRKMKNVGKESVLTVPNILSLFRLGLVPVFVRLYLRENTAAALAVLLLSGLTDVLDGYIARRFHRVSDLGKILDPVADKLTQAVTLVCLAGRFPAMLLPLSILFIKELSSAVLCVMAIRKSGQVCSSDWHGKLCTVCLYGMICLHLLLPDMPVGLSAIWVGICCGTMLFSFVMYASAHLGVILRQKKKS